MSALSKTSSKPLYVTNTYAKSSRAYSCCSGDKKKYLLVAFTVADIGLLFFALYSQIFVVAGVCALIGVACAVELLNDPADEKELEAIAQDSLELRQTKNKLEKAEERMERMEKRYKNDINSLQKENTQMDKIVQALKVDNDLLLKAKGKFDESLKKEENVIQSLKKRNKESADQLQNLQKTLDKFEKAEKLRMEQNVALARELDFLPDALELLDEENRDYKQNLQDFDRQFAKHLKKFIDTIQQETETQKQYVDFLTSQREATKVDKSALDEALKQQRSIEGSLRTTHKTLSSNQDKFGKTAMSVLQTASDIEGMRQRNQQAASGTLDSLDQYKKSIDSRHKRQKEEIAGLLRQLKDQTASWQKARRDYHGGRNS